MKPLPYRYYPYGSYNIGVGNGVIVQVAAQQIGNHGGKNFWSWYGFSGRVEWCACYVSWCADQCGYIKSGTIPKFAGVGDGVDWFKARGQFQRNTYKPAPGDIIFLTGEQTELEITLASWKNAMESMYIPSKETHPTCVLAEHTQSAALRFMGTVSRNIEKWTFLTAQLWAVKYMLRKP